MSPRIFLLLCLFLLFSCKDETPGPVQDDRMNDYALYDSAGGFHRFSRYNNKKAIVLFVQGNGCPIVRNYLNDLREIVDEYGPKGVQFFMVNSNIQDNRDTVESEVSKYGIEIPVLMDQNQILADELDIRITAEVIVLHPVSRQILYRGPLNDRLDYEAQKDTSENDFLIEALDGIINGSEVKSMPKAVRGCKVTRRVKFETPLTYTEDIAPIFKNNCVRCHRDNGMAPWSMDEYQTIVGWSDMIKEVLISKRMPPWKADPKIGKFSNSFALAEQDARNIIKWIESGMTKGEGSDPLKNLSEEPTKWSMGEPDYIVELKTEDLPATGIIPYRIQNFKFNDSVDRWIGHIDIRSSATKSVHHTLLTSQSNSRVEGLVKRKIIPWNDNFLAISAGSGWLNQAPKGTGIYLQKGSKLGMQLHYNATGKREIDKTLIGFYYLNEPPEREYRSLASTTRNFSIPAHTDEVKVVAFDTITQDVFVHAICPHMHYRGKRASMFALLPDSTRVDLVSVPDYNFNWQFQYLLEKPIFLPSGSVIVTEGIYDNTFQNPLNPNPSVDIGYGVQSTDEMLIGFMNYTLANQDTLTNN
ncbi:redoxin family protein [Aureitalea marina]|uniref:Cytochrome c domain-containing protein n=1 Tax=Aureitalea marina TaxID=930804 RepID=A0A2S7KN38_9FLAO|nr:redoxin family protein [Aureitalea marina]PQB04044.1 hypothetical protein BST85_03355 [Aureitalea marina]